MRVRGLGPGLGLLAAAFLTLGQAKPPVQAPDPLSRARTLYNAQQYDEAIAAAEAAGEIPMLANAALVVGARARLERFRKAGTPDDLVDAREALKKVHGAGLAPRDHVEFLIALGESLFLEGCLDGCFSAAAEMFDAALARASVVDSEVRETIFEWWATSLDRAALQVPDLERAAIYSRILDRAEAELKRGAVSPSASYWLAAAARGTGSFERAWGASIAGWVRSRYLPPQPGSKLREDLDTFVTQVLLPDRARQLTPTGDPKFLLDALLSQWEGIKKRW
jgi:hypothetical protein